MRNALNAIAFDQAGYFSAAQARETGYSYQAQKYHADHGNWIRVDRGLFRLPHWPVHENDAYARWSVWSGGRATVSHESALAVHGLSDIEPVRLHLTVPPGFSARDDALELHVSELASDEIDRRPGWSVTLPLRTLLDVAAGTATLETIDRAVSDGLRLGAFTRRAILRATDAAEDRSALRVERALAAAEDEL